MRTSPHIPIPVTTALKKLGKDLRNARIRRRIPMTLMSQRAFISRTTLTRVEKGDPSVSLGIYASVLFVLGMVASLSQLVDAGKDELGSMLEEENLPQRVRFSSLPHSGGITNDRS